MDFAPDGLSKMLTWRWLLGTLLLAAVAFGVWWVGRFWLGFVRSFW